jgi:hypothetical protein
MWQRTCCEQQRDPEMHQAKSFQDAIPGLFGALFGAEVLGRGTGWIGSLTGQAM